MGRPDPAAPDRPRERTTPSVAGPERPDGGEPTGSPSRGMPPGADPDPVPATTIGRPWTLWVLAALVLALAMATITLGSVRIPLSDVVGAIVGDPDTSGAFTSIVRTVRLPRAATALLAGAALGVAGLQMQTLFRNPLADPFILGISAGASVGVAVVVIGIGSFGTALVAGLGLGGNVTVAVAAAAGAAAVTVVVLLVSRRVTSPATVLIVGLMIGYAVSAVVSVLVHAGLGNLERVRAFIAWGFGSFAGTTWGELAVMAPFVVVGLVAAAATVKPLNALLLGDRYAASLGIHVPRARLATVLSASLLAGTVTAFCGPIAFIGVAVPHLARGVLGTSDHRLLVPGTVLLGAAVALVAGIAAQLPGHDATLPLNAVTALIGAPVVVLVLLRMRHAGREVTT